MGRIEILAKVNCSDIDYVAPVCVVLVIDGVVALRLEEAQKLLEKNVCYKSIKMDSWAYWFEDFINDEDEDIQPSLKDFQYQSISFENGYIEITQGGVFKAYYQDDDLLYFTDEIKINRVLSCFHRNKDLDLFNGR